MEIAMVKNNEFYGIQLDELGLPTRWIGAVPLFNREDCMRLINYCDLNGINIVRMNKKAFHSA